MSPRNTLSTTFLIALTGLGMISGSAHAALIAYDQFSGYTDGNLNGQNQGFGWSATAWTGGTGTGASVASNTGNLTYTGLTTAGGGAGAGTNASNDNGFLFRDLATTINTTGTYYFGFLMQQIGDPEKAGIRLQDSSGNNYAGAGAWDSSKGRTDWQLYRRDGGTYNSADTGTADTTDLTYFVIKLDYSTTGDETAFLYINPTNATDLAGTAVQTHTYGNQWSGIDRVQVSLNGASGYTGTMAYDEIRIGTEAADMFGVIPEPSSLALIGLGGIAALLRRRRA